MECQVVTEKEIFVTGFAIIALGRSSTCLPSIYSWRESNLSRLIGLHIREMPNPPAINTSLVVVHFGTGLQETERWTPSFGQLSGQVKVDSRFMFLSRFRLR